MTYRLVPDPFPTPRVPADFDMDSLFSGDLHATCEEECQRGLFTVEPGVEP